MARKDLPSVDESLPRAIKHPLKRAIEEIQALTGMRGDPLDRALTWRDFVGQGLARLTGAAAGSGTSPGRIDIPIPEIPTEEPDATPPPNVTGLTAVSAFAHVIAEWDAATYTQGHGHGQTNIYVAKRLPTDDPAVFSDAQRVYEATGALTIAALPAELGVRWHIWAKWQTADGVESNDPAGGTNGITVTVGKIGNADLGPLIVEAANLAEEAVDLGGTKVTGTITDPVRFGALAVGYTVTQYLLANSGVMENLVVDDAQVANLSAAKLTAGDGTVGGILKSSNYAAGSTGWLLRPSDGYVEASNAVIRGATYTGTIYAGAGTIGGFTIGAADIRSANYVPGTAGMRITGATGYVEIANLWARGDIEATSLNAATGTFTGTLSGATGTFAGSLSAATGTFSGALSAATGSFAGSLSAATGTFSGTLTASAVDAVDTINLKGEAITVPRFGSAGGLIPLTPSVMVTIITLSPITFGASSTGSVLCNFKVTDLEALSDSGDAGATLHVLRNGSAIASVSVGSGDTRFLDVLDSPGAGTWTYSAAITAGGVAIGPSCRYSTFQVMGAKR